MSYEHNYLSPTQLISLRRARTRHYLYAMHVCCNANQTIDQTIPARALHDNYSFVRL